MWFSDPERSPALRKGESSQLSPFSQNTFCPSEIKGKYGNGEERKQKLGNLYNEVQKRVNEILGEKPNIDVLARDVISGKYGNGEERKQKLGKLYNEVQTRVNEILKGK